MSTRPIDKALRRLDAVLHQCDEKQRRRLLGLARESRRRDAQLRQSVAEAHEALGDLQPGKRNSEFAQHATLQDAEHAAEMVDGSLNEASRRV